jgi:hypothetical protein
MTLYEVSGWAGLRSEAKSPKNTKYSMGDWEPYPNGYPPAECNEEKVGVGGFA